MSDRTDLEELDPGELALSRVVDRCDAPDDWTALEAAADLDDAFWKRLAESLRQDSELRVEGDRLTVRAERVELPGARPVAGSRWAHARWLFATAALVLAWLVGRLVVGGAGAETAQHARPATAERIGELVPVVVERRPTGSGEEVELILMRRYLEREVVPRLYEVGVSENEVPIVQSVWDAGASEVEFL